MKYCLLLSRSGCRVKTKYGAANDTPEADIVWRPNLSKNQHVITRRWETECTRNAKRKIGGNQMDAFKTNCNCFAKMCNRFLHVDSVSYLNNYSVPLFHLWFRARRIRFALCVPVFGIAVAFSRISLYSIFCNPTIIVRVHVSDFGL